MSTTRIGPLKQTWYKWKALRLPWRKRFLVGIDLNGNTYWEFRLTSRGDSSVHAERWRRIVSYPRSTHLSSVKVSPLWHQWLRYTRDDPPTLTEQREDVVRQVQMKQLAAEADARWEAKPKVMEDVKSQALPSSSNDTHAQPQPQTQPETHNETIKKTKEDPWAKAKAKGPGEDWQPESWNPTSRK